MREQIFIRVLDRASSFMQHEDIIRLRSILDEEFYPYTITPACTDLVPTSSMLSQIKTFLAVKKLEGLAKSSIECYGRILLKFAMAFQKDADSITDMDIRMYLAVHSNKGLKGNSLNSIVAPIRCFFRWLEDEEYIKKSPARKIKHIKVEKRVRVALTRSELEMLRDACRTLRDIAMVEFFYSTGCRLSEIQNLSKDRIDWVSKSMMVIGKGNKEREVYLNDRAIFHLKKYFMTRMDQTPAVFVSERKPHARLGKRAIEKVFSDLGKLAGIQKPVYPHLLRHTTATNMLQSGASLSEVQGLLGHENPATTQIYAHLSRENIQQSHRKHLAG